MAAQHNNQPSNVGMTHFPLVEEQDRRKKVPRHDEAAASAGSRRGHRLSRKTTPQALEDAEGRFDGKGGKGGKTGGSRAGLLSASRKATGK